MNASYGLMVQKVQGEMMSQTESEDKVLALWRTVSVYLDTAGIAPRGVIRMSLRIVATVAWICDIAHCFAAKGQGLNI